MRIVKHKGIPMVAASWFELMILALGTLAMIFNAPIVKLQLIGVGYENQTELMRSLPEIKNEVSIRFVEGSFNTSEMFEPFLKTNNHEAIGFYVGGIKPTILISINQTFEEIHFTLLHELGHHSWNYHLTAAERESFCQNSFIEAKTGYEKSEWCEENYADYYARQEMVNYENQTTLSD